MAGYHSGGSPLTLNMDTDFIIGDRVYVGNKPGIIAYLGDVKFANGDFAGVVLDDAVGKNDGSVKGTRYFQCDPLRGVFVRSNKLVRNHTPAPARASSRCAVQHSLSTPSPTNSGGRSRSPIPRSPAHKSPVLRKKSSSSTSSGPQSATPNEEKNIFSQFLLATTNGSISNGSPNSQDTQNNNKTTEQHLEKIQKEYQALMSGTRHKFDQFQQHVDQLEKENKELHKNIEEQKQQLEDLQFQLEEEVLSKEDIMQELIKAKNNNNNLPSDSAPSPDTQLANDAVLELERQTQEQHRLERQNKVLEEKSKDQEDRVTELEKKLASSLEDNKELKDELDQATNQLSDIEFQLAEIETEKENGVKDKKKMEDQILSLEESLAQQSNSNKQDKQITTQTITELNLQIADTNRQLETLQESSSKSEAKANQLREKIKRLEEQHNQDTLAINQTHENIITSLKNRHRLEIGTHQNDHLAELDILQTQLTQDITNLQQEQREATNKLTAENNHRVSQLHNQMSELQRDYQKQCSAPVLPCGQCAVQKSNLDHKDFQLTHLRESSEEQIKLLNTQLQTLTEEKLQLVNVLSSKSQMTDLLKQQVLDTQNQLITWQKDVKEQVESNKVRSEKDLDNLKSELLASQALMVSLERKLSLSEKDNVRLQSRVNILNNELNQTRQAILTSPRSNSVSSPNPNSSNGTYRDTSDFLFNQLKRQVEVMEVRLMQTTDEDLRLKDENEELRAELSRVRIDLNRSYTSSTSSPRRSSNPRLYCDVCCVFDTHNTSDCSDKTKPLQSPTKQQQQQQYCNICKDETHWTADCTADEY